MVLFYMIKNNLFKYQLISPNLPVGGFCYSEGMESFLQKKNLKTDDSIKNLILDELKFGQIRIEAKSLIKFSELYKKLSSEDESEDSKREILSLNKFIIASRDSKEIRDQKHYSYPEVEYDGPRHLAGALEITQTEGFFIANTED